MWSGRGDGNLRFDPFPTYLLLPLSYSCDMSASIFIPLISTLALIPSSNIFSMRSLLDAVWEKYLRLNQVKLSQLSLRTLVSYLQTYTSHQA